MSTFIDVDISNFDEEFNKLKLLLKSDSLQFISLDCEFTGIESSKYAEIHDFDSLQVRYAKIRQSATKFGMIQCGISIWCLNESNQNTNQEILSNSKSYLNFSNNLNSFNNQKNQNSKNDQNNQHDKNNNFSYREVDFKDSIENRNLNCFTFNFYLWKDDLLTSRVLWNPGEDNILCQISSLNFLGKHQMDFNRAIKAGISYTNRQGINKMKDHLSKNFGTYSKKDKAKKEFDVHLINIKEWSKQKPINSLWQNGVWLSKDKVITEQTINNLFNDFINESDIILDIKGNAQWFNEKLCKYIQQELSDSVKPYLIYIDKNKTAVRVVRSEHINLYENGLLKKISGFSQVIELIIESKKPIVGHTVILDLAHIYQGCIESLPFNISDFIEKLSLYFPNIIDTKILQNSHFALKGKSLEECVDIMKRKIAFPEICELEKLYKHNAGWDSYLSGYLFAKLFSFRTNHPLHRNKYYSSYSDTTHIRGFINRLFLIRSPFEIKLKTFVRCEESEENITTTGNDNQIIYFVLLNIDDLEIKELLKLYPDLQNGSLIPLDEGNFIIRIKKQKFEQFNLQFEKICKNSLMIPYSKFENELCYFIDSLGKWRIEKEDWIKFIKSSTLNLQVDNSPTIPITSFQILDKKYNSKLDEQTQLFIETNSNLDSSINYNYDKSEFETNIAGRKRKRDYDINPEYENSSQKTGKFCIIQ